ncbi:MAG: DUF1993 domain-containing protein [Arenicellales bacterium]
MNTLYDATIPVFVHGLNRIRAFLLKAEQYSDDKGIAMNELLEARLAPDMFTLTQQVGYAYFMSLEAAGNLSGKAPPEMGYDEKSAGDLYASLEQVARYLKSIDPADIEDSAEKEVDTFLSSEKVRLHRYVHYFALPNFYFHVVTTYDILRHKGVPLRKPDYIGSPPTG